MTTHLGAQMGRQTDGRGEGSGQLGGPAQRVSRGLHSAKLSLQSKAHSGGPPCHRTQPRDTIASAHSPSGNPGLTLRYRTGAQGPGPCPRRFQAAGGPSPITDLPRPLASSWPLEPQPPLRGAASQKQTPHSAQLYP